MAEPGSDFEVRFAQLEARLDRLEAILRTEDSGLRTEALPTEPVAAALSPQSSVLSPDSNLLLAGRSLIALGGAYLLRALAESNLVPIAAGIAIGFAYAGLWLWRAWTHAQHGRRAHAAFCAIIAAVIAYPIIWESATRFHLFDSAGAAIAIAVVTSSLVITGYRNGGERIAWIGSVGAIGCTVALAAETRALAAPMLALAAVGGVTWWCAVRRKWRYAPIPVAIEFNLIACAIVILALLDRGADSRPVVAISLLAGFAIFAGAIVTRPLVRHEDIGPIDALQVGLSAIPTLVGAPLVVASMPVLHVVAAFSIGVAGALAYAAMVRTSSMVVARHFFGALGALGIIVATAHILPAGTAAAVWGIAAAITAILARRSMPHLFGHAALYALVATVAAGLFGAAVGVVSGLGRHPLDVSLSNIVATAGIAVAAAVAIASGAQPWRIARLILAAIATLLLLGAVAAALTPISGNNAAAAAALRSAIIAVAAVALTLVARTPRTGELAALVYPLLILGALKFLFDDFGSGRAASLFITLATYGIALVLIARFKTPATDPA